MRKQSLIEVSQKPRIEHSLFYPAFPHGVAWVCLWHKTLCSTDTVGKHQSETEICILPPDCHKAKLKVSALQRRLAQLPLLSSTQVPQAPQFDGLSEVPEQLCWVLAVETSTVGLSCSIRETTQSFHPPRCGDAVALQATMHSSHFQETKNQLSGKHE